MAQQSLIDRTDAKLRYAKLHMKELRESDLVLKGEDYEKAHQESLLFHMFGAYAGLLQELNEDLCCGLKQNNVTLGNMRRASRLKGNVSIKLTTLYELDTQNTTWFSQAKALRDHVSHVAAVPLNYYVGGSNHGTKSFRHPVTLEEVVGNHFDKLEEWVNEMQELIERMRI